MAAPNEKEMWINFACAALRGYEQPDNIDDADEAADDMVDVSTKYADSMLEEYEKRFGGTGGRGKRSRRKKSTEEDDPED